jgi:hypothetical protein
MDRGGRHGWMEGSFQVSIISANHTCSGGSRPQRPGLDSTSPDLHPNVTHTNNGSVHSSSRDEWGRFLDSNRQTDLLGLSR